MANTKKPKSENTTVSDSKDRWKITKQHKIILGSLLVLLAVALFFAFVSYYLNWSEDQSAVNALGNRNVAVQNWLGKIGATVAHFFLFQGFGIASFIFVRLLFLSGVYLVIGLPIKKLKNTWFWDLFAMVNISLLFGFFTSYIPELGGVIGYEMNLFFKDFMGNTGTLLVLLFSVIIFIVLRIKIDPDKIEAFFKRKEKPEVEPENAFDQPIITPIEVDNPEIEEEPELIQPISQFEINKESLKPTINNPSEINLDLKPKTVEPEPKVPVLPEIIKTND